MQLHQLRSFVAVIEQGSVSAAARKLGSTPSSVSSHIKALEDEFGILLFERSHAGVAPTAAGRSLAPYARRALEAAREFASEAASRQERIAGPLHLACSVSDESFALSKVVTKISAAYPDIRLSLSRGESAQIIEQICDQVAEMGIVYGQINAVDLSAHKLGRAELVVALPAGWLSNGADPQDVIGRCPWIQTGDSCPFQLLSRRLFEARKIDPPVVMRVDDNRTRRQLVIAGMGVSLLDRHEANHPAIAVLPGAQQHCDLTLVYLAHRQFEPPIKAARDVILRAV